MTNTFQELSQQLFGDWGSNFDVDRMNEQDRRDLCGAYLREHPEIIDDMLAGIDNATIAGHVATLIQYRHRDEALQHCDVFDLALEIRGATFPNKDLDLLVQGQLDHEWRMHRKFRALEAALPYADEETEERFLPDEDAQYETLRQQEIDDQAQTKRFAP